MVTLAGDLVGQRLVTGYLHGLLADAGPRHYAAAATVASDATVERATATSGGFFFTPYYANIDKDAAPAGYDADLVGFVTGAERRNGSTLYGFHLGYGHAGIDFTGTGYRDNQEDQELLSGGFHAMGRAGNWTWRGQVGGFYGWHDYDGLTGANLTVHEQVDYDSYGAQASLLAGYLLQSGSHVLLPEAGLDYLWLHRDSFTTDADYDVWDMHSDSLDEHQVSVRASLRWLTRRQMGEVEVTPSLAAGVRYLVTDDELDVHQSVTGSAPFSVATDLDEVSGTVSASLRLRKQNLATELAYGGEFGDDTTVHSAWLRFSYLY
jgi:outer membrane autotransporter protein